jgi:hypothetical protein
VSTETWAELSTDAFSVAFFAYLFGMLAAFHFLAFRRKTVWAVSVAATGLGLAAHLVSIVGRGVAADRFPLGNMYEYSLLLSFLVVLGYLVFVEGLARVRTVGGFVLGFAVITMAVAVLFLYVGPAPLIPALNSYWRQVHVSSMIVSSSLLALGGVLTILYLVKDRRERRLPGAPPIMGGAVSLEDAPPHRAGRRRAPAGRTGAARTAARVLDARPAGLPDDRVRLPDLDVRHHHRRDLGGERVGALLGVGPEGDLVVHHVGGVRRVPARSRDVWMEGPASGDRRARRVRSAADHVLRRQPMDRRPALVRDVSAPLHPSRDAVLSSLSFRARRRRAREE